MEIIQARYALFPLLWARLQLHNPRLKRGTQAGAFEDGGNPADYCQWAGSVYKAKPLALAFNQIFLLRVNHDPFRVAIGLRQLNVQLSKLGIGANCNFQSARRRIAVEAGRGLGTDGVAVGVSTSRRSR